MSREDGHAILSSACFQLGVTGSQITQSFSRRIEHIGLSHKQVGLLAVVDAGVATPPTRDRHTTSCRPKPGGHTG